MRGVRAHMRRAIRADEGVGLPGCPEGSYAFPEAPNPAKSSQIAACAAYDRDDPVLRRPPGCDWYETPSRPEGRQG